MSGKRMAGSSWLGLLAVLVVWLIVSSPRPLAAGESIAEAEGLECRSCHTRPKGRRLNDRGRFYELTGSLAGYEELDQRFKSCSACHRGKPGGSRLTATGRRYQWFFEDMEGVRDWVMSRHPDGSPTSREPERSHQPENPGLG